VREGKKDLGSVRRDLHHVSEMMPLEKLLRFFLSKRAHLAIVVDEYGGALGIVTLDNVIEELVGSIHDEFDAGEETEIRKINEDEFDVDGTLPLHEVSELIDAELQNEDVSTIGGYITSSLGHIPQKGEKVTIGSFTATVVESDPRRVVRVHFLRQPSEESPQ
jgi:CBS domain containing-hemolysin-like protein